MQVFLPWPSFEESARALDRVRLQKQIVEVYQVTRTITGASRGWRTHPVISMWQHHLTALAQYAEACTTSWNARGGSGQRVLGLIRAELAKHSVPCVPGAPWFVEFAPFHAAHQLNLVRKQPGFYLRALQLDGIVTHSQALAEPYLWPVAGNELQVGPRGTGRPWQDAFMTTCSSDGTLIVTRDAATARYERDFPALSRWLTLAANLHHIRDVVD